MVKPSPGGARRNVDRVRRRSVERLLNRARGVEEGERTSDGYPLTVGSAALDTIGRSGERAGIRVVPIAERASAERRSESNASDKAFAEAATHEVMPAGTKAALVAVALMPGSKPIRGIRISDETAIELIEADWSGD
jgi:hypothetical protein